MKNDFDEGRIRARTQVWDQTGNRVWDSGWYQAAYQIFVKIWGSAWTQVLNQVGVHTILQVKESTDEE